MPCELTCPGEGPSCGRLRDLSSVCPSQVSGLIASHRSAPSSRPTRRKHASDRPRRLLSYRSAGGCGATEPCTVRLGRGARVRRAATGARVGASAAPHRTRDLVSRPLSGRRSCLTKSSLTKSCPVRSEPDSAVGVWCRAPPRRTLSPSRRASRPSPHGGLLRAGTRLIKYKLANATRDNTIDSLDAIL
jgi:hypothetical protein